MSDTGSGLNQGVNTTYFVHDYTNLCVWGSRPW